MPIKRILFGAYFDGRLLRPFVLEVDLAIEEEEVTLSDCNYST